MGKGSKVHSSRSYVKLDSVSCQDDQNRPRKGYVPVMVGKDQEMMERLDIPTKIVEHPYIVNLLEMSADEFGYGQQGLIRIQDDPDSFKQMVKRIAKERRLDRSFSFPF
ncbi:hypothetical protein CDL15_Pgr002947 [Punica granatum]|uniref:Auxin-responsive protein SAUR71-like n=1 Tax=Punica granatum TaxID=22663 RepID=A0A218X247_PUNGR|nr:hypothetical protein CDL15_Pgr002947 [Punica granatum]PKI31344.1 hypothetical protein CRG98_048270 [Punica granatum]